MNDTIHTARATGNLSLGDMDLLDSSTDVVDLRRRVGIVFQKANPFPKSIFENVAFGPRLHMRLEKSELSDLVEWAAQKSRRLERGEGSTERTCSRFIRRSTTEALHCTSHSNRSRSAAHG